MKFQFFTRHKICTTHHPNPTQPCGLGWVEKTLQPDPCTPLNLMINIYNGSKWLRKKNKKSNHIIEHLRLIAWCFTNANRFISQFHMECILVNGWVNSHTRYPHLMSSSNDPNGNLSSIRNQNFLSTTCSMESSSTLLSFITSNLCTLSSLPWKVHSTISHHKATLGSSSDSSTRPHK